MITPPAIPGKLFLPCRHLLLFHQPEIQSQQQKGSQQKGQHLHYIHKSPTSIIIQLPRRPDNLYSPRHFASRPLLYPLSLNPFCFFG